MRLVLLIELVTFVIGTSSGSFEQPLNNHKLHFATSRASSSVVERGRSLEKSSRRQTLKAKMSIEQQGLWGGIKKIANWLTNLRRKKRQREKHFVDKKTQEIDTELGTAKQELEELLKNKPEAKAFADAWLADLSRTIESILKKVKKKTDKSEKKAKQNTAAILKITKKKLSDKKKEILSNAKQISCQEKKAEKHVSTKTKKQIRKLARIETQGDQKRIGKTKKKLVKSATKKIRKETKKVTKQIDKQKKLVSKAYAKASKSIKELLKHVRRMAKTSECSKIAKTSNSENSRRRVKRSKRRS
eukprot:TRINITY_DN17033_c0_g1_i1.p1 TRINITY_DN17033_c0_g1~~TRINITY_DN17033_c0_g1_i1.p1  ORF type:complete len:302 (+),score=45.07 TRINITY_DN17033_c0_g1_i1:67-972(+)